VSDRELTQFEPPEEGTGSVASAVKVLTGPGVQEDAGVASQPSRRGISAGIAWLTLVLLIVLAGAIAWIVREGQIRAEALEQRLAQLEILTRKEQASLDELGDRLQRELRTGLDKLEIEAGQQNAGFSQSLEDIKSQLDGQQKALARFSPSDRHGWLLAEAGHLLRLANQRLVMAGDPIAAQALLNSADGVLRELDDPSLHPVRAALAADVAALRAVEKVDVEGIYLRLAALIEQAEKLVIFEFPEPASRTAPPAAENWEDRLQQGVKAAFTRLSDYVIIRRRDVPMKALMDPQWESIVRQNLRMLLEQSQVALLSGNQTLYAASLERAQHWVAQFRESDAAADAISEEIAHLEALTIQIPQPDISRSQQALDDAIEARLLTTGTQ
jgi:uroporphyrin-3 C-methyltransferase